MKMNLRPRFRPEPPLGGTSAPPDGEAKGDAAGAADDDGGEEESS
jgi:hypothetical protein